MYNLFNYSRRKSAELKIGNLLLGGNNPIRVQTMANTDTNNTEASVQQTLRAIQAGSKLMRFTTQGIREVESLNSIRKHLISSNPKEYIPLVADIHFNAAAAMQAARYVEKVRINPGNFVASIKKKDDNSQYTAEEYRQEFEILKERFIEFLNICKSHNTTIRIGVNHGSLSQRIMSKHGDTSQGMVESCMELLRVCREENFTNVVISMKTSNTVFMVHTVRLLVNEMNKENFAFPLHLGVTEAGNGEDGRIKSAVGIGALLADGIGDTIRVSLSEDPEFEIPVANTLVGYVDERAGHKFINASEHLACNYYEYEKRKTYSINNIGGNKPPVVIASQEAEFTTQPDYFLHNNNIVDNSGHIYPIYEKNDFEQLTNETTRLVFLKIEYQDLTPEILKILLKQKNIVVLLETNHQNGTGEQRAFFHTLLNTGCTTPVIICRQYEEQVLPDLQIKSAADNGLLFIDGFGDGILLKNTSKKIDSNSINSTAFGILQAARVRTSKTEYISCPGCGRTLFDLQKSIASVKEKTSHLAGLKIAIMGCIVNGPGEMADADYGYVGAARGKVSLYKKKECVERNIPEDEAVGKLIELINREK